MSAGPPGPPTRGIARALRGPAASELGLDASPPLCFLTHATCLRMASLASSSSLVWYFSASSFSSGMRQRAAAPPEHADEKLRPGRRTERFRLAHAASATACQLHFHS